MLKLNASYSKKVPAETEYSSQAYHAQIEVELPDGLTPQQIQERIHGTFAMVRDSVEAELNGMGAAPQGLPQPAPQSQPSAAIVQTPCAAAPAQPNGYQAHQGNRSYGGYGNARPRNAVRMASSKQIDYLLTLAKRAGWSIEQLLDHAHLHDLKEMPSKLCSDLIGQFKDPAVA